MAKKTEHAGDKGCCRKGGFVGRRAEAKQVSKEKRRTEDRRQARVGLREWPVNRDAFPEG